MRRIALLVTAAALLCAGCGPAAPPPVPTSAPTTSPTTVISQPATSAPTSTPTSGPAATSTTKPPPATTTSTAAPAGRVYPWHNGIVSTTFWVGELYDKNLADGSQVCSTYDSLWAYHWSGVDAGKVPDDAAGCAGSIVGGCDGIPGENGQCSTEARRPDNGYWPTSPHVKPRENPFYLDVPFDDLNDSTAFKQRCKVVPWANDPGYAGHCTDQRFSYMKNAWLRIVGPSGRECFGQVEDAGPSSGKLYHDAAYVFGSDDRRPAHKGFNNAGMDVSPALNGCLGFADLDGQDDRVRWQFVDPGNVPPGPWTRVITTSPVKE